MLIDRNDLSFPFQFSVTEAFRSGNQDKYIKNEPESISFCLGLYPGSLSVCSQARLNSPLNTATGSIVKQCPNYDRTILHTGSQSSAPTADLNTER
jgi:hypothetical protein